MRRIIDKKVEEVMTKDVVTVTSNTTIQELKELWAKHDFNVFPVVEDGKILGVVTKLDFLKIFAFDTDRLIPDLKSIFAQNVGDIMSRGIIAVCEHKSIQEAASKMRKRHARCVLVTDETKKHLKGIISRGDIVKFVEID